MKINKLKVKKSAFTSRVLLETVEENENIPFNITYFPKIGYFKQPALTRQSSNEIFALRKSEEVPRLCLHSHAKH